MKIKKILIILAICVAALTCGIAFAACDTTSPDLALGGASGSTSDGTPDITPKTPTLEKTSFAVRCSFDGAKTDYELTWLADYATEYKVVCDGVEDLISDARISLNGYSADEVHTVTVTALGAQGKQSDTVEVKFKGTKLDAPVNVRLYGDSDGNSFGWKECDGTSAYRLSCEELDLDGNSKPVGTGKFKHIRVTRNRISIEELRQIFSELDLYALESFRVCALPYNGSYTILNYKNDTDVLDYSLPSDYSEQSVNFYAGKMSNPYNLRWDFEGFEEHTGYATVRWDGANSNYKYQVITKYPEYSRSVVTENGATESTVGFGYSDMDTGEYTVTVLSEYDKFDYIGEDENAKSVTYMFYFPSDTIESLTFRINSAALQTPVNVRIEDDLVKWDEVENAKNYYVTVECGDKYIWFNTDTAQESLQTILQRAYLSVESYDGDYDIQVYARAKGNELVSLENGIPVVNTYDDSETSEPLSGKLKLKSIPVVQNVKIDYENNVISWDDTPEATSYTIMFYDESSGSGRVLGKTTQFDLPVNIADIVKITIESKCEYSYTVEDGVVTLTMPSTYTVEL